MRIDLDITAIVLNDQLGRGRSSNTAAIVVLIQRWLRGDKDNRSTMTAARRNASRKSLLGHGGESKTSWQIINSCLRVIRNGLEVKRVRFAEDETDIKGCGRGYRSHIGHVQLARRDRGFPRPS